MISTIEMHIYSKDKVTQHGLYIYICIIILYVCMCEHSTVIYSSIAILHWGFYATARYPDGIARGMVSETPNATHPFTRCRLVCFAEEPYMCLVG